MTAGVGDMALIDGTMNAGVYIKILKGKMKPSIRSSAGEESYNMTMIIKRCKNHTRVWKEEKKFKP